MIRIAIVTVALLSALFSAHAPAANASAGSGYVIVAQQQGTTGRELQPRYEPAPPQEKSSYNSDYIFSLTRGVADSTLHPAAKAPMFLFTVPIDLVLLPITSLAGLF